jgi:hypothetical protein
MATIENTLGGPASIHGGGGARADAEAMTATDRGLDGTARRHTMAP